MKRSEILETASKCVCEDREQQYGKPENNFYTIANLWTDYIYGKSLTVKDQNGVPKQFDAHDVANMMCLLKIARIASGQAKEDNYIDIAGYAACAGEIATGGRECAST